MVTAGKKSQQSNVTDISAVPVFDQAQLPICVPCAEITAISYLNGKNSEKLSRRALYKVGRLYSGLADHVLGSMPRDVAKATVKFGIPDTTSLDDDMSLTHARFLGFDITETLVDSAVNNRIKGYAFARVDQIRDAIDNFEVCTASILISPQVWSQTPEHGHIKGYDGTSQQYLHRVVIYGYGVTRTGDQLLYVRNSWGEQWGDHGCGTISLAEYRDKIFDIIVYTDVSPDLIAQQRKIGKRPQVNLALDIKAGEKGQSVRALQSVLAYEGLLKPNDVDGVYGPKTVKAVQDFQFRYAIATISTLMSLSGGKTVGPNTRAVINKLYTVSTATQTLLQKWAFAIQTHEGYFAPGENKRYPGGTRAWKNNNPGNIKFTAYTQKAFGALRADDKGFAVFRDYQHGFVALCEFLRNCASNKLRMYRGTMSLVDFFRVYAPSGDSNDPDHYARVVAKAIGVPASIKISELI